jgi:DNA-binding Lrp family transcriptional regulator
MGEERQDARTTPPGRKFTVSEAAVDLNISAEAVRSRIKRGTLRSVKEGSTVYVLLAADRTTDQTRPGEDQTPPEPDRTSDQTALLEHLEAEISYLREQLDAERQARTEERRRADTVIAQLTSRIPQIEAPQEPQNQAESAEPRSGRGTGAEEPERATQRPWWRKWLGG